MSSYIDIFGGNLVGSSNDSYSAIALNSDITLSWPTDFQNGNSTVTQIMDVTASQSGWVITLPNATNISNGVEFSINNLNSNTVILKRFDGTTLSTLSGISFTSFYLASNSTTGGVWRQILPAGSTGITSVAASTSITNGNITVSGSPITTTGTFSFGLGADLASLTSFSNLIGIATRKAANTWGLTSMTGTLNQIQVTNGDGVDGDPTFSLFPNITGLTSAAIGNLSIIGNTVRSTNSNGGIALLGAGTADIVINPANTVFTASGLGLTRVLSDFRIDDGGALIIQDSSTVNSISISALNVTGGDYSLILPGAPPEAGQVMSALTDNQLTWANIPTVGGTSVANTIPIYINTGGSLGDSDISITGTLGNVNNISGVKSIALTNLTIGVAGDNIIASTDTDGPIRLIPNGAGFVESTGSMVFLDDKDARFSNDALGTNYVGFKAPVSITSNTLWSLPEEDATLENTPIVSDAVGNLFFDKGSFLRKTTSLNSLQIQGLNGTPIEVVSQPVDVGSIVAIHGFSIRYSNGGTDYTGGGNISLQYGSVGGTGITTQLIGAGAFTAVGDDTFSYASGNLTTAITDNFSETAVYIWNATAPFLLGDGTADITVWYSIVPL